LLANSKPLSPQNKPFAELAGQTLVNPVDDRSPMAKSLSKVSEITAVCLLMIVPALIGYFVDQWLGTGFVFTLLGLVFGMTGSVYQLMQLVQANESRIENVDLSKVKKFEDEEEDDWNTKEDHDDRN
jgi:F0F1-type ATP synthase assembly protein I